MKAYFKQHRLFILSILAYLAGMGLAAFIWFGPGPTQARMAKVPGYQPAEDWVLCEDLGVGPVPGVPDFRQRFRICHPEGWEFLVYCLDPGWPTPRLGSVCTETGDGVFDCGGYTQRLRLYEVVSTPPPRPTRTPTRTRTATPTRTLTPTSTLTPTPTRRVQFKPTPTVTPSPFCDPPESCVERPHPGGRGNLIWLGILVVSAAGLVAVQGGLLAVLRRKK